MKILFKRDTQEQYKRSNYIPEKDEIFVIKKKNGSIETRIGDGIHFYNKCKKLKGLTLTGLQISNTRKEPLLIRGIFTYPEF